VPAQVRHVIDRAIRIALDQRTVTCVIVPNDVQELDAVVEANPINPQRVFWELSPRLPDHSILTCDAGTSATWYARDLKVLPGMMGSLSGGLASMGSAVPYAIAATFVHPERPVIALLGDGAMQMVGINALITLAHHWREWRDPRVVVMVLRNDDLNMVTWEQRATDRQSEIRCFAESAAVCIRGLRTLARVIWPSRRSRRRHRRRVGAGIERGPPHPARIRDRSHRSAASAARG